MESLGTILRRIAARQTWTITESDTDGSLGNQTAQPRESCAICSGVGWVTRHAPIGHPDFGSVFPCECQVSPADRSSRIGALERYSNLGPLRRCVFVATSSEQFLTNTADIAAFNDAYQAAQEYADNPVGWISFAGPSGSGKTWLAAAIANHQIELERSVLFVTAADLLDYLRSGFDDDVEHSFVDLYEQVRDAQLLVLDDLPTRPTSPWGNDKLFQLLAHRHASRLPTVVTLRGDLNRLEEFLRTRLDTPDEFARLFVLRRTDKSNSMAIGSIPHGMRSRMTFDSFTNPRDRRGLDTDQVASLLFAHSNMQMWTSDPTQWKLLTGPAGVGKTHLAVAAASEREKSGDTVFFSTVPDLLDHLRSAYAPDNPMIPEDLLEAIKTSDLLVLDDFGAERSTDFAEDKLFQVINYRYEERLPTIITTSLDFGKIEASRPRIASRLADRQVVSRIPMSGNDYRKGPTRMRG